MDEFKIYIKAGFMAAIGFFEYLVGGIDNCIKTLLIFMVVDVLTGIRKAAMGHSEKSVKGYLDSEVMWKGGIKKLMIIVAIYVAVITRIKRIEVHDSYKDENGKKRLKVDIYFTAVGLINIPTEKEIRKIREELQQLTLKTA